MAKLRKQICELTLTDLEQHPVWEFALDEEGVEEQDEATVRPADQDLMAASHETRIVRANFSLADGTRLRGYLYEHPSGDTRSAASSRRSSPSKGKCTYGMAYSNRVSPR